MGRIPDPGQVRVTVGALLAGGLASVFLSGIVAMQAYLYYRVYPKDKPSLKFCVSLIWFMDFIHTIMVCIADWVYLIEGFGDRSDFDHINWSIGATITLTAVVTFTVHCFFTHRIYVISRGKRVVTFVLATLACLRLTAALVSTSEMIVSGTFRHFIDRCGWVFTTGLSLAVSLDVLITIALSHFLRESKSGFASMNEIVDTLILYTVETGLITALATIISLICWLTMSHNLIFLTLHFTISKLYANSFLATLNSRAKLRARSQSSASKDKDASSMSASLPIFEPNAGRRPSSTAVVRNRPPRPSIDIPSPLQLHAEKTDSPEIDAEAFEEESRGGEEEEITEVSIEDDDMDSPELPFDTPPVQYRRHSLPHSHPHPNRHSLSNSNRRGSMGMGAGSPRRTRYSNDVPVVHVV